MSDTPETDTKEDASHNFAEFVVPSEFARKLERERGEARAKLADWEDSAKHVRKEWPDEQHCSCVPILRKLLKDAERERDEAKDDLEFRRELYRVQENYLELARRERDEAMALSEERYNYWQDSIKEYEEMRGKWREACAELDQIKRVK
jgi:hypothetical protein